MSEYKIESLTLDTVQEYGLGCLKSVKHVGFAPKTEWFKEMSANGLTQKQIIIDGKSVGFIEYVPGEHAWRAVKAPGYMVVHCIWVYPKVYQKQGYGAMLVQACIEDARSRGMKGVAVVTSEGTWIASRALFTAQGFEVVDRRDRFELLALKFDQAEDPIFTPEAELDAYDGFTILISDQCPMNAKFVHDIQNYCDEKGLEVSTVKITSAEQAQRNPGVFGVFAILYQNKVVADHPVSLGRFKNIVHKELKL